jgi:hypothetical protein
MARRYVRKADLPPPRVANDDYTEPCDRCGAPAGQPCTIQGRGFRQWPNAGDEGAAWVPAGTVALRIHYERGVAVRRRREQATQ